MRDATQRLLAPGGCLVPCGARVYCMAVELRTLEVGTFKFRCLDAIVQSWMRQTINNPVLWVDDVATFVSDTRYIHSK